ncbi:unnamed protein product [Rotaria sp. Silwood2]|nr:unnamed protein product [Rotaria sp. Silwood2]
MEWKCSTMNGKVVDGGNQQGDRSNQLNSPANVIINKENDSIIICDQENRRVVRWPRRNGKNGETIISNLQGTKEGIIIADAESEGQDLTQLSYSGGIAVDHLGTVYVVDFHEHRVMHWLKGAKQGISSWVAMEKEQKQTN